MYTEPTIITRYQILILVLLLVIAVLVYKVLYWKQKAEENQNRGIQTQPTKRKTGRHQSRRKHKKKYQDYLDAAWNEVNN